MSRCNCPQYIYLFDLDDTLLSHKCKVPRQTWWLLARLAKEGHGLGIVSNNPLLVSVAAGVGLTQLQSKQGKSAVSDLSIEEATRFCSDIDAVAHQLGNDAIIGRKE